MIETILLISAIIYLVIASINDIRFRFVHDYATYSFGALFIILRLMLYFESNELNSLIGVIYFVLPTLLISYILYKIGAWGGGDLKLLTALAIGIPFLSSFPTLFLDFLTNTVLMGLVFGLSWSLMLMIKNLKKIQKIITKLDFAIIIIFFIIGIIFLFLNNWFKMFSFFMLFLPLTYLSKKTENITQVIDKKVKNLEEGDWILADIKIGRKTVKKSPTGLSKKDIIILQKSKLRKIKIKDGIPFVPSFLLGLITSLTSGNLIVNIVSNLILR